MKMRLKYLHLKTLDYLCCTRVPDEGPLSSLLEDEVLGSPSGVIVRGPTDAVPALWSQAQNVLLQDIRRSVR